MFTKHIRLKNVTVYKQNQQGQQLSFLLPSGLREKYSRNFTNGGELLRLKKQNHAWHLPGASWANTGKDFAHFGPQDFYDERPCVAGCVGIVSFIFHWIVVWAFTRAVVGICLPFRNSKIKKQHCRIILELKISPTVTIPQENCLYSESNRTTHEQDMLFGAVENSL